MENGTFDLVIFKDGAGMRLIVRDASTGVERTRIEIDGTALGGAFFGGKAKGGPCQFWIPEQNKTPTKMLQKEALVEMPVLPPTGAPLREKIVNDILRPYEVDGWKAERAGIDDKNRIARTLPDGTFLVNLTFTKQVVDQAAVHALKTDHGEYDDEDEEELE